MNMNLMTYQFFPESEVGALVGFINDRVLVIKDKLMEKKEEKVQEDFE